MMASFQGSSEAYSSELLGGAALRQNSMPNLNSSPIGYSGGYGAPGGPLDVQEALTRLSIAQRATSAQEMTLAQLATTNSMLMAQSHGEFGGE